MSHTLYIVATPVGNLSDVTFRALDILRNADVILCEDTRVTRKLLSHYDIQARLESFHAHSTKGKIASVLRLFDTHASIALVTDAGTPGISDPGAELVSRVRAELPHVSIVPIPGPSALTALMSVAGFKESSFTFLGFAPHKKGRETFFRSIAESSGAAVFYESPHRIMKSLGLLEKYLAPSRRIVVGRELTKLHEEVVSGSIAAVHGHYASHPDRVRGEFVVAVEAA